MELAAKILILGGVLNILYSLLTGIPVTLIRQKNATYSKYLRFAHVGPLMWGPTLISLTLAIKLSTLSENMELAAAWLMVSSSVFLGAKDTINWLLTIQDEFVEKPLVPLICGGLSALTSFAGIGIILFGVVQAF